MDFQVYDEIVDWKPTKKALKRVKKILKQLQHGEDVYMFRKLKMGLNPFFIKK